MSASRFRFFPGIGVALALVLAGCANVAGTAIPPPAAAAPAGNHGLGTGGGDPRLDSTLWYQRSAEAPHLAQQSYVAATGRLAQALRESGSAATEQPDGGQGKPAAVVFDVDETVLDNSPYQAHLIASGTQEFDRAAWDRWVAERKAKPIAGATAFVQALRAAKVRPVFITNRSCEKRSGSADPCPQAADTLANLRDAGFGPVVPDDLLLVGQNGWTGDKTERRRTVAQRYRIVMLMGDQLTDFLGVPSKAGSADRQALADAHSAKWGARWFLLPNPMYGGWLDSIPTPRSGALRTE